MALIHTKKYVKVNSNNELLLYPYNEASLKEDNPYTKYNFAKKTLYEWYNLTEDHLENNNRLIEVYTEGDIPREDNKKFLQDSEPTYNETEDKWVLGFTHVDMTEEEIESLATWEASRQTATD